MSDKKIVAMLEHRERVFIATADAIYVYDPRGDLKKTIGRDDLEAADKQYKELKHEQE